MKKLFLVMMATFLIVATNAIAAGTPSVNSVLSALQNSSAKTWKIGGRTVKFFMHEVKTRKNKAFAEQNLKTESSSDGYFYFMQNGKRVKYTVKQDDTYVGTINWIEGEVFLNGKKVGEYSWSFNHGEETGTITLKGKRFKITDPLFE